MEKKPLKFGVIGLGRGSALAYGAKLAGAKICAICDSNSDLLAKAKAEQGEDVRCYDDFDAMLASDIDAVIVANYATEHAPFAIRALEAGKHVISEIPAVNSLEEAKRLKAAVLAHPKQKYMIAENCCYWAFIQAWKVMRDEGRFGDIVYAEGEYLHAVSPDDMKPLDNNHWRTYYNAIRYSTHELGPLLYILDDRCVSVTCMESAFRYNPAKTGREMGAALFRTEKGTIIRILINFGSYVGFDHNFRLQGTRGSICTDMTKPLGEAHSFANLYDIPGTMEQKLDIPVTTAFAGESRDGHGGADPKMMKAFIDCVENDAQPPLDIDFALKISLPGLIAHESAEKGGMPLEIPVI